MTSNSLMNDVINQEISMAATLRNAVPKISYSEINLGNLLGSGGFSRVHSIRSIKLDPNISNNTNDDEASMRKYLEQTVSSDMGMHSYVIKALKPELSESEQTKGMVDLATEARFLQSLDHDHIIALRATSDVDPLKQNFFIVLDHLLQTLDQKIWDWNRDIIRYRHPCCLCVFSTYAQKEAIHSLWMDRICVARDIASALQYIHENGIVFRDLKPDNIGFTEDGQVKLFDFGLAKDLDSAVKIENDLYKMTGNTGSLRYMAPEVVLGKPYNQSVDAYSFGILFWQLCSLKTPYAGYTMKMHSELVVRQGDRPKLNPSWESSWINLMEKSWAEDISTRPSFNEVVKVLEDDLSYLLAFQHGGVSRRGRFSSLKKKSTKREVDEPDTDNQTHETNDISQTSSDEITVNEML